MKYTLDRSRPLMACQPVMTGESHWNMGGINGGWLVGGAQQWPKTQTFNNCMRGISPYVTIAASLAEATTHWDAVSELWVASGYTSLHSGSSHCVKYFRKCRPVDSTLCTTCIYITAKAIGLYILQALSFLGGYIWRGGPPGLHLRQKTFKRSRCFYDYHNYL